MRLLIVTESFLPRVDGVSRSVSALTRHCRLRGVDAVVVAPGHGPHEADGFPVVRVMGVAGFYPGLVMAPVAPGMNSLIERFAPDAVHLASPAVLGAAALRAARRRGVPVAAHFQTDVAAYARHYGGGLAAPVVRHWLRHLHNRCDITYAPTPRVAAGLRVRGVRRVAVSGRGVDTELFRPDRPGAAARNLWAPGGTRVLCVARLAPEKGLERLVALARRRPELSLLLVGAGPLEAALKNNAPGNVRLTGLLEGDDLADAYAAAEVFAFPSVTETFGQVVQEAMASGLPVVGMRAGGVGDIVVNGRTGWLADPQGDDFEELVVSMASDPAAAQQMGRAGHDAMAGKSWARVFDRLLADYAEMRPRGRRRTAVTTTARRPGAGRAAAFFDLDRTVIAGSSFLALAPPLVDAGLLSRRTLVRAALHQLRFRALGASEIRVARAAARGAAVIAGIPADKLRQVGRRAVATHVAPLVYPAARQLIAAHHAAKEPVFLVSSAPEEIVAAMAELLGADGWAASRAEIVDGRYTGRLLRLCQGHDKVRAMEKLAERHGVDLRLSTAYGDSSSDAPMLAAAGTGVCVNPDRLLRGMARLRGWEVRRFRLHPRELGHPARLSAPSVTVA